MIKGFLSFIRFSHTIFALPFALGSMFVAARGLPPLRTFALVVLAMVFARTAAMTFNRLADWEIDKRNPRTAGRHKLVSKPFAIAACGASSILFIATTWFINALCFALSPLAMAGTSCWQLVHHIKFQLEEANLENSRRSFRPPYPSTIRMANCKEFANFSGNVEIDGASCEAGQSWWRC